MARRDPTRPRDAALVRLARALSSPLRIAILRELAEGELSPVELSRMLDADLGLVAYHVRYLADLGALELRRAVPRRGALKHYYALTPAARSAVQLAIELHAGANGGTPSAAG